MATLAVHPAPVAMVPGNGTLVVPLGVRIHDVGNPDVDGSEVGNALRRKITSWKDRTGRPLFLRQQLGLGDINQECVGDCWYLAALISIINHARGTEMIKGLMVDRGDGTVVVRVYSGEPPAAMYLRISKSVLWFLGFGKVHASGLKRTGLWPAILEKAASCFSDEHTRCDPQRPHYKNLEGGQSHRAFAMLLGKPSHMTELPDLAATGMVHGNTTSNRHMELLFVTGNWNLRPTPAECLDALNAIFGWRGMSVERWREILKPVKEKRVLISGPTKIGASGYERTFFELMSSPEQTGLPAEVGKQLADYARRNNMFAGEVGTGRYSQGLQDFFQSTRATLMAGGLLCMGTKKTFERRDGRGHSAGEDMLAGMASGHAYAILDTFEETAGARRKYLKVANPWGRVGRAYKEADGLRLSPEQQESGVFWLELADFAAVAQKLYACRNPAG